MVFVSRSVKYVVTGLLVVTLISVITAMFTSVGFPYHADPVRPTRQRLFVHVCHILLEFHILYMYVGMLLQVEIVMTTKRVTCTITF